MAHPKGQTGIRRQEPGVARAAQDARRKGIAPAFDAMELPAVLPGDLWEFGSHLALCGDSTSADAVAALMGGESADLVVTDPPYGVGYRGKGLLRTAIRNDDLAAEPLVRFLTAAFLAAPLKPGGGFYIFGPAGRTIPLFFTAIAESGLDLKQTLVWAKNHFVVGRSDYHHRHEWIAYGWKPGAAHYYAGGRKQHTVWNFDKPQRSPFHPTTKPIPLLQRAIENSSREGEIVFDGFLGSGSTLLACETAGRRCRAIEIEPHYVAVAIWRFEQASGKRARLVRRAAKTPPPSSAPCRAGAAAIEEDTP